MFPVLVAIILNVLILGFTQGRFSVVARFSIGVFIVRFPFSMKPDTMLSDFEESRKHRRLNVREG